VKRIGGKCVVDRIRMVACEKLATNQELPASVDNYRYAEAILIL
jgi:hypothetical protein